jgi:hypothetical protein
VNDISADTALVVDTDLLDRLEAQLGDAAETLEIVEGLRSAADPVASAARIRELLEDGRFTEAPPKATPEVASDLVGDGHIDAAQEVDSVSESDPAAVNGDPSSAEISDSLEGGAEVALERVNEPAVSDDDRFSGGQRSGHGIHATERTGDE